MYDSVTALVTLMFVAPPVETDTDCAMPSENVFDQTDSRRDEFVPEPRVYSANDLLNASDTDRDPVVPDANDVPFVACSMFAVAGPDTYWLMRPLLKFSGRLKGWKYQLPTP